MKFLKGVLMLVLVIGLFLGFGVPLLDSVGVPQFFGVLFTLFAFAIVSLAPRNNMPGVFRSDLDVNIWQDHIEGNIFKDDTYLLQSRDESQYVTQGKIVVIPQAGALPAIEEDRSSFPATVVERTDSDVEYTIRNYSTDPILLPWDEQFNISYNKRESVLSEHERALNERIAERMIRLWAPSGAGNIIRTTGGSVAAHLAGTTGQRKLTTIADFKLARLMFGRWNVPQEGRNCLISSDMLDQLTSQMTPTEYKDFSQYFDAATGRLGRFLGFDLYERSTVASATNASTPVVKAFGAAAAETDNDLALFWHKERVCRAKGKVKAFYKEDDPTYYGSIFSFAGRAGGRIRREDANGVLILVQAEEGS